MSFATTFNVFQISNLTNGQQHVLAGISTFTDANGKGWPSVGVIADRCLMSIRTVQRHIDTLKSMGYLKRIYRKGRSAITILNIKLIDLYAQTKSASNSPRASDYIVGVAPIEATCAGKTAGHVGGDTTPTKLAAPQAESSRHDTRRLGEVLQNWRLDGDTPTPVKLTPPPPPNWHPESVIESVNTVTAQPSAPELAESPAIAAVVVSESADTEVRPAVDLVEDDPLAEVPAALLVDFAVVRKAKKKAGQVTRTEAVVFAAEAKKAGMTPAQAVEACIHRGWSRFEAAWLPQSPAMPVQRVYVPEVAPPASPDVIAAGRAALAALREKISRQGKASTTWATAALAKAAKGEHVAPAAMAAAKAALRL